MDVKELRERLGLNQTEFARKLGVAFATVNRWEQGKCKPSAMARQKLETLERKQRK